MVLVDLQGVQFCWHSFSVVDVTEADSDDSSVLSEVVWLCEEQAEQSEGFGHSGGDGHSGGVGLSGQSVVVGQSELGGSEVIWQ